MKCEVFDIKDSAGVGKTASRARSISGPWPAFKRFCVRSASTLVSLTLFLSLWCTDSAGADLPIMPLKEIKFPTGIDYWPAQKKLLFADYNGGVYGIHEDGTHVEKVTAIRERDCVGVVQLRVDGGRNRLWILAAAGICVYDLQSLHLIRHLPAADMSQYRLANGLTDIALDQQGNAYAIDSGIDPIIYRIDATTFAVSNGNKGAAPNGAGVYSPHQLPLNAIAVTPQGGHLLYVNAYEGALHVVDIRSGAEWTVTLPNKLYAVNGLIARSAAVNTPELMLYVISARNDGITTISMTADLKAGRARVFATKYLDQPHAAAWAGNALFVTNGQLPRHPQFINEDRAERQRFSIARLNDDYFSAQAANPILDSVLWP